MAPAPASSPLLLSPGLDSTGPSLSGAPPAYKRGASLSPTAFGALSATCGPRPGGKLPISDTTWSPRGAVPDEGLSAVALLDVVASVGEVFAPQFSLRNLISLSFSNRVETGSVPHLHAWLEVPVHHHCDTPSCVLHVRLTLSSGKGQKSGPWSRVP